MRPRFPVCVLQKRLCTAARLTCALAGSCPATAPRLHTLTSAGAAGGCPGSIVGSRGLASMACQRSHSLGGTQPLTFSGGDVADPIVKLVHLQHPPSGGESPSTVQAYSLTDELFGTRSTAPVPWTPDSLDWGGEAAMARRDSDIASLSPSLLRLESCSTAQENLAFWNGASNTTRDPH